MIINRLIINGNINKPQKTFVLKKGLVLILTNLDFVLKGKNLSLIFLGLIYGGFSLYLKYQGFSKFMNQTRATVVKIKSVEVGVASKKYRALSILESHESIEITSKFNGVIDVIK